MQSYNVKMVRPQQLAENIVVVDGISCSGKSLIAPIISTLVRSELWQQNYLYEYICTMEGLGRISRDAAMTTVRLYADLDLYNSMIARGTNMRPTDVSSTHTNLLAEKYEARLSEPDGDVVIENIRTKKPILPIMTHYIIGITDLLFESFAERLKLFVLPVRHPLWLMDLWNSRDWYQRIGEDPREYQLCCEVDNQIVPWFAFDWAQEYLAMKPLERSIHIVSNFWKTAMTSYDALSQENRDKVLFVPFEEYCASPWDFINRFMDRLETEDSDITQQMLDKLNLPRTFSKKDLETEKNKFDLMLRDEGIYDSHAHHLLLGLCEEYESKFLKFTS